MLSNMKKKSVSQSIRKSVKPSVERMRNLVCYLLQGSVAQHTRGSRTPGAVVVRNYWVPTPMTGMVVHEIHWPTEGLKVCELAEQLIDALPMEERSRWLDWLAVCCDWPKTKDASELKFEVSYLTARATCEQRLEALCRYFFPAEFSTKRLPRSKTA